MDTQKLPKGMYEKHGAFYLVRKGKWHRLGADLSTALSTYSLLQSSGGEPGSLAALVDEALNEKSSSVKKVTMLRYRCIAQRLAKVFAEFTPSQVRPVDIARFLSSLRSCPNTGNHALTVLRITYEYALERQLVESNPCAGIKRLSEGKRDRLLTADEIQRILDNSGPRLQCIIEMCIRTGQRINDVLKIKRSDLTEEGISVTAMKTGKRLVIGWTPELRETVERAKSLTNGSVTGLTLFQNSLGRPFHYATLLLHWHAALKAAGVKDARIHDLRAYAATVADAQGLNATALLGHSSASTTARYLRDKRPKLVQGPVLPAFKTNLRQA